MRRTSAYVSVMKTPLWEFALCRHHKGGDCVYSFSFTVTERIYPFEVCWSHEPPVTVKPSDDASKFQVLFVSSEMRPSVLWRCNQATKCMALWVWGVTRDKNRWLISKLAGWCVTATFWPISNFQLNSSRWHTTTHHDLANIKLLCVSVQTNWHGLSYLDHILTFQCNSWTTELPGVVTPNIKC